MNDVHSQGCHDLKPDGKTYENPFIKLKKLTYDCNFAFYALAESDSGSVVRKPSVERKF